MSYATGLLVKYYNTVVTVATWVYPSLLHHLQHSHPLLFGLNSAADLDLDPSQSENDPTYLQEIHPSLLLGQPIHRRCKQPPCSTLLFEIPTTVAPLDKSLSNFLDWFCYHWQCNILTVLGVNSIDINLGPKICSKICQRCKIENTVL